jgi:radical SAM protein with 4Fe4S-binding SPASM domain
MKKTYVTSTLLPEYPLWEKVKQKRIPFSFDLELTARCNNRCRHCYIALPARDREAQGKELSCNEIMRLADQSVDLGVLWCLITGGEPLLRPDFPDIYLGLKKKGLLVSVFTNACLVTEKEGELFQKYPPRDLEVTVYGATEETYEKVTGTTGSYRAFRRGLDILRANNVKVRMKAMALRSNLPEFSAIAEFCRVHTCDYFRFDPLLHFRYDRDRDRNDMIREERLIPREIAALDLADRERFEAVKKECEMLLPNPLPHSGRMPLFYCNAGKNSFTITSAGRFQLCSSLSHPECTYDLRQGTLKEAWNVLVPRVLGLTSDNPDFINKCRPCPLVNLCLWCPAHAYLETGRLDGWVEYFCEVAKEREKAARMMLDVCS